MFIDTHCHINMMIKNKFDVPATHDEIKHAQKIIDDARDAGVATIINVGTSLIESVNCVALTAYPGCYAAIGIHPNDVNDQWHDDLKEMKKRWLFNDETRWKHRIVALGEVGLDYHYPNYNKQLQRNAFKAHIELALEQDYHLSYTRAMLLMIP